MSEDFSELNGLIEGLINCLPGIKPILPPVSLVSGLRISVQAGARWRCTPCGNFGPYDSVEVCFKTHEDATKNGPGLRTPADPEDIRVYPDVPVVALAAFILNHCGFSPKSETDGEGLKRHGITLPLLCDLN